MLKPHWIPAHRGPEDIAWFKRMGFNWLKVITTDETIPHVEDLLAMPAETRFVIRNHPLSELYDVREYAVDAGYWKLHEWRNSERATDKAGGKGPLARDPIGIARDHAAVMFRIANWAEARGLARDRLWFEGLNEPMLWGSEPPALTATYYQELVRVCHEWGGRVVAGNFGVGWPGSAGPEQPVEWDFWKPVDAVMIKAGLRPDILGLHEYWPLAGPQDNWRWLAGRYTQCPFNVPILVTECGIDRGVEGLPKRGWHDLPGSMEEKAETYVNQLVWYAEKLALDWRLLGATIFTYDGSGSEEWAGFDIRRDAFKSEFSDAHFANRIPAGGSLPVQTTGDFGDVLSAAFGDGYEDLRGELAEHPTLRYNTRPEAKIANIAVHHTATPSENTSWKAVALYHVQHNDWPGIGYHVGIGPDGTVSYLQDLRTVSYHVGDDNATAVGVCCAGDYTKEVPADAMIDAAWLVIELIQGYLSRDLRVAGHKDYNETACPGELMVYLYGETSLEDALWAAAEAADVLPVNPQAALTKAIVIDNPVGRLVWPTSGEFEVMYSGATYVGQRARVPNTDEVRVYYCVKGDWGNVQMLRKDG